jgi:hypothetical protein
MYDMIMMPRTIAITVVSFSSGNEAVSQNKRSRSEQCSKWASVEGVTSWKSYIYAPSPDSESYMRLHKEFRRSLGGDRILSSCFAQ